MVTSFVGRLKRKLEHETRDTWNEDGSSLYGRGWIQQMLNIHNGAWVNVHGKSGRGWVEQMLKTVMVHGSCLVLVHEHP